MSRWEAEGRLADVRSDIEMMERNRANLVIDLQPLDAEMFGRTHLAKVKGMGTRIPVDREGYTKGPNPRHVSEAAFDWFTAQIARILRSHASRIDGASLSSLADGGTIFDINGNRVGSWKVTR